MSDEHRISPAVEAERILERGELHPLAQQVSDALRGAIYPLRPRELAWVALQNDAPASLLSMISGLPERRYPSLDEVQRSVEGPPGPTAPTG